MTWAEGLKLDEYLKRTEPGIGYMIQDEGINGNISIKMRSTPNVSTARLKRRLAYLHLMLHTEQVRNHDDTRRALINEGVHLLAIRHELTLRGEKIKIGCRLCDNIGEGG